MSRDIERRESVYRNQERAVSSLVTETKSLYENFKKKAQEAVKLSSEDNEAAKTMLDDEVYSILMELTEKLNNISTKYVEMTKPRFIQNAAFSF